jgi:ribulose-phosphate 3-epimerase
MSSTKKYIEIIPAVLPSSFKDLEEHLALIKDVAKMAQIDVVDGHYAKGKTWPYRDRSTFEKIVQEEHGLPFWGQLDFQFDLMLKEPALEIKDFVAAGGTQIILHARSDGVTDALQPLIDMREGDIGGFSVRVGIAIGPAEPLEILEPLEAQFDFVQVMGIAREGRQGEPFDRHALYLVERLRHRYPQLDVQIDGGVTKDNARELVSAGATRLVVGSAIFGTDDPVASYKELYNIVNAQ